MPEGISKRFLKIFTDGEVTILIISQHVPAVHHAMSEEVFSLALETPLLPQLHRVSSCGGVCISL